MNEAILLPSPNWFLVSGMAFTIDGWVIYGGPSKSLCILEPLDPDSTVIVSEKGYRTHFFPKVHGDKITSLDISPAWLEKNSLITGSADGSVKLWNLEKIDNTVNLKYLYNHSLHSNEREDVVGVGYSTANFAITVGSFGRIVKWDLQSNIVKTYNLILSKFKPTCMACSPHLCLQVAVGTKQGVVLLVDLNDTGTTLFKVRSHDEEVLSMSWCPQFTVSTTKYFKVTEPKYSANKRMEKIRQEASPDQSEELNDSALTKTLPEDSFDETMVEEEDLFDVYKDHEEEEFGHKKYTPEIIVVKEQKEKSTEFDYLAECKNLKDKILGKDEPEPESSISSLVDALDKTHVDDNEAQPCKGKPTKKGDSLPEYSKQKQKHLLATIGKHGNLRMWSKNGRLVGSALIQNKYVPNKNLPKVNQPPWGSLLWYKPDVLLITDSRGQLLQCNPLIIDGRSKLQTQVIDTVHKRGTYCIVSNAPRIQNGHIQKDNKELNGNHKHSVSKDNLAKQDAQANQEDVQDNQEDKQKDQEDKQDTQKDIEQSNSEVVLPEDQWYVWTAAQDRTLVCYSMTERRKVFTYHSCGGYVYNIQTCPYDAKKIAVCVGDGAIRVWEANLFEYNDEKLSYGHMTSFWQNVQGKVLVVAWHPTRENMLAFGTAESRVGIIDVSSGNADKPAKVLNVGITGSVYSLCWGERNDLYVCGGGDIVLCHIKKESESKTIPVELDGEKWRLSAISWYPTMLFCGSTNGSVALLSNTTYEIQAVNFIFKKLINSIELHPQFTSSSSEESSLKYLIAVSSMDKCCKIAILKHSQTDEGKHELKSHKFLEGHKGSVMQLAWSPHHEGRLASTSCDHTARVWDVPSGTCTAIYPGNNYNPISVAWSAFPHLAGCLMTGGADHSVRLWKIEDYPPEAYKESLPASLILRKEKKKRTFGEKATELEEVNDRSAEEAVDTDSVYGEGKEADQMALKLRGYKRFLLPICCRQMSNSTASAARKLAEKYIGKDTQTSVEDAPEYDMDFLKMFGSTNELNELLDYEMEHHLAAQDTDAWIMLAIFRGQMDRMIQFAKDNDLLCPFLVSLSPCVSFKYWKDVTQLYLAQIDRCIAQQKEYQLMQCRSYGGAVFRKAALLLSAHDVAGAVRCLLDARLFRDAYVLCRARYMESIARDTLQLWLKEVVTTGYMKMAVICNIALGELYQASTTIVGGLTDNDESWLSLAADLAKMAGQHTFAGHLEDQKEQIKQNTTTQEIEDTLQQLPSRIELILKNSGIKSDLNENDVKSDLNESVVKNVLEDESGASGIKVDETKE